MLATRLGSYASFPKLQFASPDYFFRIICIHTTSVLLFMKFTLDEEVVVTRIFMVTLFQLVAKITFGVVTLERYEICEFVFMDVSKKELVNCVLQTIEDLSWQEFIINYELLVIVSVLDHLPYLLLSCLLSDKRLL